MREKNVTKMNKIWSALVLTCSDQQSANAFRKEIETRQKKLLIHPDTLILCVVDPKPNIGSGGATLNAILNVTEHISALKGYTVISSDVLSGKRILIIHMGTSTPYSACSPGFLPLPAFIENVGDVALQHSGLATHIDILLQTTINVVAADSPSGFWVCSCDRLITIPTDAKVDWSRDSSVYLFGVPVDISFAANQHGVIKIGKDNMVEDIIYKGSEDRIKHCLLSGENVLAVSGLVFFKMAVADALLNVSVSPPLDACTYLGLDAGSRPTQNRPLPSDVEHIYRDETDIAVDEVGSMGPCIFQTWINWTVNYARKVGKYYGMLFMVQKWKQNQHSDEEEQIVIVNSIISGASIGNDCVILHSCIEGDLDVGSNSMLVNIKPSDLEVLPARSSLPSNIVFEALSLKLPNDTTSSHTRILIMFGINDKLQKSFTMPDSTVFNKSWHEFFERTRISPIEIWSPEIPESKRCILNARLFPVYHPLDTVNVRHLLWLQGSYKNEKMANIWRTSWRLSLFEILDLSDPVEEFNWRTKLFFNIGQKQVSKSLLEKSDRCFIPFFQACIMDGYFEDLLQILDGLISSAKDPAVISRAFACIADVLGAKANGRGGLRSGPAANYSWKEGLNMLQDGHVRDAVQYMASQRSRWLVSPDLLVRAARHYEGAFQIQVRKAVSTARQFIKLTKGEPVSLNTWVTAEAPARADLAGTWSDTPPICFDQGGAVVTLAIKIDSQKPIGCRVKRIPEPKIVLALGKDNPLVLTCTEVSDLINFSQPNSPGALLKAAFFCTELIPLKITSVLSEYLARKHGGGFFLQTWSNLPHGSGLGTSSILAGAVISALWTVTGMNHDLSSVLHAVLDLEQMLTTGGGWQDQVGGLCPGIKVGSSKNQLPLHVEWRPIKTPDGFIEKLERHLLVVFTGKTRLARNMLQDVLRNWNARFPEIVKTASELIQNANNSVVALEQGNLELIGKYLDECWKHKKSMAHGCEPNVCREIMNQLRPYVYGQCLAGAGGGGFMYIITKEENAVEKIREEIMKVSMAEKATVHYAHIDQDGLTVRVDDLPSQEEI